MNRASICPEFMRAERNSGILYTELDAELTIEDAMRRAALGLSFDLADSPRMASDSDFDAVDPTNVIGLDVDEAFELNQNAGEYVSYVKKSYTPKSPKNTQSGDVSAAPSPDPLDPPSENVSSETIS